MNPEEYLDEHFPNLKPGEYKITSPETAQYNCIAWAAGCSTDWWWPDEDSYWPPESPRQETMDAFLRAFPRL